MDKSTTSTIGMKGTKSKDFKYIPQEIRTSAAQRTLSRQYNSASIEKKWQKIWKESKLYATGRQKGEKKYVLVELAYSSGDLHIGHWFAWSGPDAYARYLRMKGYDVLFPVGGFDSFGLPAENAAIKRGIHPADWTNQNIETMRLQFETMGPSFDWEKEVITSNSNYYKWTQWLFLQFYKKGLAYKAKAPSNWCPECKTVLANEHVVNGCCWRHTEVEVIQKDAEQWFIKITDYADKLIWPENPGVDWPQETIAGQNKWIGKKQGINIAYKIEDTSYKVTCWTSRPDTNFGATFIVLAPDNKLALKIATKEQYPKVEKYIKESQKKMDRQRLIEAGEKTGVFTGRHAINQLNGEKLPIWVSDFVISGVGTGAVVGVPGHDKRDFEFANKFGLPIKRVVVGSDEDKSEITKLEQVQEEQGTMINSDFLDGLDIHTATEKMMDFLEKKGWGKRASVSHLRDWSVSRQRYWGAPVPIIHCQKCGTVPVPEEELPVTLPYEVDYTPTGKPPLATAESWLNVKCPRCGGEAKREPETLDAYVDSAWYFLRYPDPKNDKEPFDKEIVRAWLPLEVYFGGREHILGHTLYARFVTKFLEDLGFLDFREFAKKRVQHGDLLGPDGRRMSKSRGNVVNPDEQVSKYGADTVRCYLCFFGPYDQGAPWSQSGVEGMNRFLNRVWRLVQDKENMGNKGNKVEGKVMHQAIKRVTDDLNDLRYNRAIAGIMEYVNSLEEKEKVSIEAKKVLLQLLAPFAPHMTEELWEQLGEKESIHVSKWPQYDESLIIEDVISIPVQVNGKLRGTIEVKSTDSSDQKLVETKAREEDSVAKYITQEPKKVIFVPGKLINFVV